MNTPAHAHPIAVSARQLPASHPPAGFSIDCRASLLGRAGASHEKEGLIGALLRASGIMPANQANAGN